MPNCLYCLRAKQLAEIFGLEHEYKQLTDLETKKQFFKIDRANGSIPQIIWGEEVIVGYTEFEKRVNEFIQSNQE